METFWEWVEPRMKSRGWDQERLAEVAGVTPSLVSRMKKGAEPDLDNLQRIAQALGSSLLDMLSTCGYGNNETAASDVIAAVQADPGLIPKAKAHLINQYGLLLMIEETGKTAESSGGPGLRSVARKREKKTDGGTRPDRDSTA